MEHPPPLKRGSSKPRAIPPPPGNTGTHWTGPNTYLLSQLTRANYITSRRTPFTATSDSLCAALQRLVHHEGNRPPNRKILLHLRLLTYYPPNPAVLPELITLLESENVHVCRLAHYHLRQAAPVRDPQLYRELVEALEREVLKQSPARRAAATKTLAKLFLPADASRATDFVVDVFNCIGGARVKNTNIPAPRKVAGVEILGTDKNKKKGVDRRAKPKSRLGIDTSFLNKSVVAGESYDATPGQNEHDGDKRNKKQIDDGAGGAVENARGNAVFIKSKFGKMLLGHTVFAAMRRINRVANERAKVESYLFDSGLMSIVPSTVRHCIALLELRCAVSPGPVSRYLVGRLPHKKPAASKRLHLEELGARIYFARLLSALAEDPNLSVFIPDEAPLQAKRQGNNQTLKEALAGDTVTEKASNFFKFLFNKERAAEVAGTVKSSTSSALSRARTPLLKTNDPLGVEFAEALVNLLKNASNRVLIEALRGLSRRRWTTWFEAPIPQGALYNSPELQDAEAYGGATDAWGLNEDDDDDDGDDGDDDGDDKELGAYENDVIGDNQDGSKVSLNSKEEVAGDPDLDDLNVGADRETWLSRLRIQRQTRRTERIDKRTPFYLQKVGQGMVPALEVILRRINGALLNDEPIRRFSAADAIVVLARAKIYGHSQSEHEKLRRAQGAVRSARGASSSRALVAVNSKDKNTFPGSSFAEEKHPFEAMVRPLAELVEEDPSQFVRGRAAVALLFVIAAGAGREILEPEGLDIGVSEKALAKSAKMHKNPLLLRFFRNFVTRENAGSGIGLRLMTELIDYLVYEILDVAPELAPSAIEMAELWAMTHPTVGVCGRLGALWEKALSIGQGEVVGKSVFRAITSPPRAERVASAAIIFLRRRTLDLAIITVGSSSVTGLALPEPLPRAVGVEMEKYFSLLWHAALLGPSAECRTFAVEALGGAAALAGEPFRVCTYERLVELVRMRGFGLKLPAEQVLNCLDMLYFSRERFSEARAKNRIARDGSTKSKQWLELVWKLAAESSSAAQILLGVPPPTGWQPLGPSGAADLANAEYHFGDVRDRQDNTKLKDASVALASAPGDVALLAIESPAEGLRKADSLRRVGSGRVRDVPPNAAALAYDAHYPLHSRSRSRSRSRSHSSSRSRSRPRHERYDVYGHDHYEYDEGGGPSRRRGAYEDNVADYDCAVYGSPGRRRRERSRSGSPAGGGGGFRLPRSRSDLRREDEGEKVGPSRFHARATPEGHMEREQRGGGRVGGSTMTATTTSTSTQTQEEKDFELAFKLQQQENGEMASLGGGRSGGGSGSGSGGGGGGGAGGGVEPGGQVKETLANATDMAGKLFSKGLRGGKSLTNKAVSAAAKRGAADKMKRTEGR